MKKIFLILTLVSNLGFSQTTEKAITIIEDISNWQEDFVGKITYYNKIEFDKKLQKITVTDSINFGNGEFSKYVTRFYLEDLDKTSMKYDYAEVAKDKFMVAIDLSMKSKSVEVTKSEITNKFKYLVSDTTYYDKVNCFGANSRLLPLFLIEKYVRAVSELLGIKEYHKEDLFKN
jgi:hypothetical protein